MIALKICGMLLIIFCTTSIGMAMAAALTRRVTELETAFAVLGALESELSYTLSPPDEAVEKLEALESFSQAAFLAACASYCRRGFPFPQAWKRAVEEQHGELLPDDVAILSGLAETLGQQDLDAQLARIAQARVQLRLQLEGARERCTGYSRLYRTMGLLSGAFIVVILI